MQLEFTSAEQRRPINWRELLGILRVVEFFGERLRGRLVLIETDNMAAKCAASKLASSAPDMQELLRRLLEAAERWGIKLRFTHTPGVKLHRPDQTSRGDPVEEPRVRLIESEYRLLEAEGPDHDRSFVCAVRHSGTELARGTGKSKKAAEMGAAAAAIEQLRTKSPKSGR